MPNSYVEAATEAHALELAAHLSPQSLRDLAVFGLEPCPLCVDNVRTSICAFAGMADDRCVALFGVAPDADRSAGQPWLLTSEDIAQHTHALARGSRQYMALLQREFTWLHGWVAERNTVSRRWLAWMGFTLASEPTLIGNGQPYYPFDWRAA